ncbi:OsmC family protein [Actomonas aquatica]|uniref:OsmC family protein n=1 Tax=Actomonas aquatica TaxID=2866162 RepID=A0ABZ1C5X0_9BACT|nr:OsmC family protein [Opitutus sp. WL0086]WRQ85695.1 OsmC family protein [Opitutus sp. WL0086]
MAEHLAIIAWQRPDGAAFSQGRYSREHTWTFDGGLTVPASPAPSVVPAPWSNPAHVDPEEAFVASISSCHMLWWLALAAKAGLEVTAYRDRAVGVMARDTQGRYWVETVTLYPEVSYEGESPSVEVERELHHRAHEACFIANSVKTQVTVVVAER